MLFMVIAIRKNLVQTSWFSLSFLYFLTFFLSFSQKKESCYVVLAGLELVAPSFLCFLGARIIDTHYTMLSKLSTQENNLSIFFPYPHWFLVFVCLLCVCLSVSVCICVSV